MILFTSSSDILLMLKTQQGNDGLFHSVLATSSLIHEYFFVYRTQQGNGGLFHSEPVGRIGYF